MLFLAYALGFTIPLMAHQSGYLMQSMFLALATMYPDVQVLLMFIIPLKAKWMGYFSAALMLVEFIIGAVPIKLLILASMAGYLLFFGSQLFGSIKALIRRLKYKQQVSGDYGAPGRAAFSQNRPPQDRTRPARENGKVITGVAFHRCTVCGITELDDPNMTFRYCSACNGSYEYCENHIHNHQHIT